MGDEHPVKKADVERDPEKEADLNAFRERAKQMSPESAVHRVYAVFNSLEEFKDRAAPALAELRRYLDKTNGATADHGASDAGAPESHANTGIPKPPVFYAAPDYIGSHEFIGRAAQLQDLQDLQDWAKPADPSSLLLFEAIGGNGKSLLTWEWARNRAGRFPYVWRYELTKSTELLQRLAVSPPQLPRYDPAKDEKIPLGRRGRCRNRQTAQAKNLRAPPVSGAPDALTSGLNRFRQYRFGEQQRAASQSRKRPAAVKACRR